MSASSRLEAEQQEYVATLAVRGLISLSCCMLVTLAWLGYDDCIASLSAMKRAFQAPFSLPHAGSSFDVRVLDEFNHARVARAQYAADGVLIPLSAVMLPLVICLHASSSTDWDVIFRAAFMCWRLAATLYVKYWRKSPRFRLVEMELFYKAFILLFAVRTHLVDTQRLLMYGGVWSASRVALAAWILDCKMTVRWNAFLSAVTCLTFWNRREELCTKEFRPMAVFAHYFAIEVFVCMVTCCASVCLELGEKERIKSSIESNQSGRAYRAVQRLLGVFCDAHLHICPQYNIISHSPHLLHLLGGSEDVMGGAKSTLHASNFLQYVGESDRQRFQDWFSATAVVQAEDFSPDGVAAPMTEGPNSDRFATRPATSIHVSLHKGGKAHAIPVELFLTYIADFTGAPEFLMGIRETCEAPPREACTDAPGAVALQLMAASEAACGSGPDVAQVSVAQLGGRALAPTLAPLAVEQVQSPASVLAHWQLACSKALAAKAQSRKSRSSISSSSRTSSSSAGTSTQEGCVSAVCLRMDTSSRSLRVDEMLLRFEIGRQQSRLKDWLPKELLDEITRNIQELVNQREYADGEEAVPCIGLGAMRFARNGSTFLIAESAELVFEPPVLVEESDCFNPFVHMNLTGVSRLRMPWQSVPQKVSRSLPTIDESLTDAACDVDAPAFRSRTSGLEKTAGRESAQSTMGNRSVESTPGVVASAAIASER
ncbi:unnamed protein product [Prorocentrum cordatum]|uniref:Mannosyltransferase n=1 Tax=Prorocentrum cordatum TaxID=2364126 RepID=A0ABN9PCN6_9DINO|nr:unnamed protein product [Polarella glacialis]